MKKSKKFIKNFSYQIKIKQAIKFYAHLNEDPTHEFHQKHICTLFRKKRSTIVK